MTTDYVEERVKDLAQPDYESIERILIMERQNTIARIINQLHAYIEDETTRHKEDLCTYIIHVLRKELL